MSKYKFFFDTFMVLKNAVYFDREDSTRQIGTFILWDVTNFVPAASDFTYVDFNVIVASLATLLNTPSVPK